MGTLVAMHYPTVLAFGAADHTYVMCGTGGKAWSCWGGKTGGAVLRSGSGSTSQADAIAEHNERAGITCYLINGVCHQAANRILFPAGIFVTGARGYGVSSAMFGPYGRPRGPLHTCSAPFNHHAGVVGDLPACVAPPVGISAVEMATLPQEHGYFERVTAAYRQVGTFGLLDEVRRDKDLVEFMRTLFDYQIVYNLGVDFDRSGKLLDFRVSAERSRIQIETEFADRKISVSEFVARSDMQTISFQKEAASVLNEDEYSALFNVKKGEFIALADPAIVPKAYPQTAL
ncbi:MAG TPA: hypothetical protein VFK06_05455 [Candidatus Angelobacter sp.]|nr:hypothetical protein [Candidatus Angelobacter sp.]